MHLDDHRMQTDAENSTRTGVSGRTAFEGWPWTSREGDRARIVGSCELVVWTSPSNRDEPLHLSTFTTPTQQPYSHSDNPHHPIAPTTQTSLPPLSNPTQTGPPPSFSTTFSNQVLPTPNPSPSHRDQIDQIPQSPKSTSPSTRQTTTVPPLSQNEPSPSTPDIGTYCTALHYRKSSWPS